MFGVIDGRFVDSREFGFSSSLFRLFQLFFDLSLHVFIMFFFSLFFSEPGSFFVYTILDLFMFADTFSYRRFELIEQIHKDRFK